MKVISCYTPNYKDIAGKLQQSLDKFFIDYDIEEYEDLGSWQENTFYKTIFIKKKLEEYKKPLVWLDADARVVNYPELFDNLDCDVGYYRTKKNPITSTVYFDYNSKVLELIERWIKYQEDSEEKNLKLTQQNCFNQIDRTNVNIEILPFTYCCILDDNTDKKLDNRKPVIIQTQASRVYREY